MGFSSPRTWLRPSLVLLTTIVLGSCSAQGLAGSGAALSGVPAPRPHIVVLMIDDLGWRDLEPGAWADPPGFTAGTSAGSPRHFSTPRVAQLAAQGVRFSEAYAAAPVCTPTRTSLMLGQSPARTGITYWTKDFDRDQSSPFPPGAPLLGAPPWRVNGIQPGTPTLASRLRGAGYRTIHLGKAHFGTGPGGDPRALGFDVNIGGWAAGGPGSYYGIDDFGATGRQARRGKGGAPNHRWDVPGLDEYHGQDVFLTDVLAAEAVKALGDAVAEDRRAFLHFAPYGVHAPLMVNERLRGQFPGLKGPELAYATMVRSADDAVGAILDALEELAIADETLVIFTSDNGGLSAHSRGGVKHGHNAPLRSGKGAAYEGGLRVPLIVRYPGVTEPGSVIHGPVVTQDLFTTLLGAADAGPPEHGSFGIDLGPTFRGDPVPADRPLLWHQPHYWGVSGPGIEPFSALRMGPWKLIYFHASQNERGQWTQAPRAELFHLHRDPTETKNLWASEPDQLTLMAEQLSRELEAAGTQMSIVLSSGEPTPLPRDFLASRMMSTR